MSRGSIAVAIVQRQIMVVQAAKSHSRRDKWLDIYTFVPFGERVFIVSTVPQARIAASDILTVFPRDHVVHLPTAGILELSPQAFSVYTEISAQKQKRYEEVFTALCATA